MMNKVVQFKEITSQIFFIRGVKVMLDFHLASLYEVETRSLKQQVRRNSSRFPNDFMFQLSETEWKEHITNCDMLGANKFSPVTPFAFTEQGVAMLSGIINSERAINVNISIMRAFVKMRVYLDENKDLRKKLDTLESKYDQQFKIVFDALRQLLEQENKPRKKIGYKISNK